MNFQADIDRQQSWLDEAIEEQDAIRAERDALKQADGTVDAADQAEFDRLDGEFDAAKDNRDELEG
jgi:hypothetical protein